MGHPNISCCKSKTSRNKGVCTIDMSDLETDLAPQEEENNDPSTCNCAENATVRRHCFNYKECKTEWDGPAHFIEQWSKCPYHRNAPIRLDSPNVHLCAVCDTKYVTLLRFPVLCKPKPGTRSR